jgi:hypothetical protein
VLISIDGSGPDDDAEYRRAFAHSFLSQIDAQTTQAHHLHYRGPNLSGGHLLSLDEVARQVRSLYDSETAGDRAPQVFLAGYSRGAAAMVHVAYLLQPMGIDVDALFLFDAVDRSIDIGDSLPTGNVDVVPRNVYATYHARRHPAAHSRDSFSNTALRAEVADTYHQAFFLTTHGGMGGTPWGYAGLERGRHSLGDEYTGWGTTPTRREWIRRHGVLVEHGYLGGGDEEALAATLMGVPSDGYTSLTMEQEEAGAAECARWMWRHLHSHQVLRAGSEPRLMPNRGHFGEERF